MTLARLVGSRLLCRLAAHDHVTVSAAGDVLAGWSRASKELVVLERDGSVRHHWEHAAVDGLAFAGDGASLEVVVGQDIEVWDVATASSRTTRARAAAAQPESNVPGRARACTERFAISTDRDAGVILWDRRLDRSVLQVPEVTASVVEPVGRGGRFVLAGALAGVRVIDLVANQLHATVALPAEIGQVVALTASADGATVVAAGDHVTCVLALDWAHDAGGDPDPLATAYGDVPAPIDPAAPPFGGADRRAQVPPIDPAAPPFGGADRRAQVPPIDPTAPPFGGADRRAQVPPIDPAAPPFGGADRRAQVPPIVAAWTARLAERVGDPTPLLAVVRHHPALELAIARWLPPAAAMAHARAAVADPVIARDRLAWRRLAEAALLAGDLAHAADAAAHGLALPGGDDPRLLAVLHQVDALARVAAWAPLRSWRAHGGAIVAVGLAGTRVVSAGDDLRVRIWDAATGERLHSQRTHEPARCLDVAGGVAAAGFASGGVTVWDVASGTTVQHVQAPPARRMWERVRADPHAYPISGVLLDGGPRAHARVPAKFVTVGEDEVLRVWDGSASVATLALPVRVRCDHVRAWSDGSGDAGYAVLAGGRLRALGRDGGDLDVPVELAELIATALSPRGEVVVGCADGRLAWRDGAPLRAHDGVVRAVATGPGVIVSCGDDGTVRAWRDGLPVGIGHHPGVVSVAIDRTAPPFGGADRRAQVPAIEGDLAVSGSADGTITVWPPVPS